MSTETKNNWRLLHELVLKAKAAKDFETLGRVIEQLSAIMKEFPPCFDQGRAESYFQSACGKAIKCMAEKLIDWQENPPPIAPQETQIGPGNPFPIPPPPPTAAGENTNAMLQEYVSIDELKERVQDVLRPFVVSIRDARVINGDFARQSMNLISERIDGVFSNLDAKTPTVAHGEWTGALVFERIAPKGLTNPVGYLASTPEEQAELDRIARAINRNPPLFDPKPQAPGSLDELRKAIICAITNEKEAVNGPYGGADVGLILNALARLVDKAFAEHAAQNAKAIEEAAEPVKRPEPWTGDELYEAFRQAVWGAGKKEDWQRCSDSMSDDFKLLAVLVNQRMGFEYK